MVTLIYLLMYLWRSESSFVWLVTLIPLTLLSDFRGHVQNIFNCIEKNKSDTNCSSGLLQKRHCQLDTRCWPQTILNTMDYNLPNNIIMRYLQNSVWLTAEVLGQQFGKYLNMVIIEAWCSIHSLEEHIWRFTCHLDQDTNITWTKLLSNR